MGKMLKHAALGCAMFAMTACSTVYRNHGYTPSEADLATVIVGVDTRATLEDQLGEPTAEGVSGDSSMYYVSSRWRHLGPTRPRPISREVVAISFDDNEVVSNIARYGLEDGRVVVLNRRVTEEVDEISFIRQLLGGVGRVSTADLLGGS